MNSICKNLSLQTHSSVVVLVCFQWFTNYASINVFLSDVLVGRIAHSLAAVDLILYLSYIQLPLRVLLHSGHLLATVCRLFSPKHVRHLFSIPYFSLYLGSDFSAASTGMLIIAA